MTNFTPVKTENETKNWINTVSKSLAAYSDNADERFFKSALIAIVENETLMACMKTAQGQASVYHSLKYAASTGLSINPQEGKAALIAYNGKQGTVINYQIMKNGMIELAMRSGKVEWLRSEIVRENDEFTPPANPDDKVKFIPDRKNRGNADGYFAEAKMKDGAIHFKYMTVEEVEEHRDHYSSMFKNKPDASPWKHSFNGMALKTVIKALFRNVYISDDMDHAMGVEDTSINHDNVIDITDGFSVDDLNSELDKPEKKSPAKKEAEKSSDKSPDNKSGEKPGDLGF